MGLMGFVIGGRRIVGPLALLTIALCGPTLDSAVRAHAVEYLDSGVPTLLIDGERRVVRPPGALIHGEIVDVRSAVKRPSVPLAMSMEQAGMTGGLYSIAKIRVDSLLAGEAPRVVAVYWNQYVRRDEDGRALHSSSTAESGINLPLLPGLRIVARIAPDAHEWFGGTVDRESGLWMFRDRPYFTSPFVESVYREYTFPDEVKEALLEGWLTSGLENVYDLVSLANGTSWDEAVAILTGSFDMERQIWEAFLEDTGE